MSRNDGIERVPGRPFTYGEIELYLAGEASEETTNEIQAFLKENPGFKSDLEKWEEIQNPIPFSQVSEFIRTNTEIKNNREYENTTKTSRLGRILKGLMLPQVQGALAACLIVSVAVGVVIHQNDMRPQKAVTAKGMNQVSLMLNGHNLIQDSTYSVVKDDVLTVRYRHIDDFYLMMLYQDDMQSMQAYIGNNEAQKVAFSIKHKTFNGSIALADDFTHESVWILTSEKPFKKQDALDLIAGSSQFKDIALRKYQLHLNK